jgi:hypothetical protein
LPERVGECARTHISKFEHRLEVGAVHKAVPGSGSAIEFANGLDQVSYGEMAQIDRSRRGVAVLVCLVAIPRDCPRGDNRGKIYTTTDRRTVESWTMMDSQHSCGGA